MKRMPDTTKVSKLGFTGKELKGVPTRVKALTRADLISLVEDPTNAPAALKLTFKDLQGLQALAASTARAATSGGSGDGGIRCCCCVACCCCCAVAVSEPELVTQL